MSNTYDSIPVNFPSDAYGPIAAANLARAQEQIAKGANIDQLTNLPNRTLFMHELNQAIREVPGHFGLVFLDIDDLKKENDANGHAAGDILLKNTADALKEVTRHGRSDKIGETRAADFVGGGLFRWAGDEFVMILKNTADQKQVDAAIHRIHNALEEKGIRASMGGRVHDGTEPAESLIIDVDGMMFAQKNTRKAAALNQEKVALMESMAKEQRAAMFSARLALERAGVTVEVFYKIQG